MRSAVTYAIIVCAMIFALTTAASAQVPAQFIAKMYTEALGRAPDATGWQNAINWFTQNGCSQTTLTTYGKSMYLNPEYAGLGYDAAETILTIYRGVLSREPDSLAGFNSWASYLNQTNLSTVLDAFFNSAEFAGKWSQICNSNAYSWGAVPALAIGPNGAGFQGGTAFQLQQALTQPPGSTVWLAPRAVVTADQTIVVPAGVTLATTGPPNRFQYAKMARIVRTALSTSDCPNLGSSPHCPVVRLEPGAKLASVWVSGQRPLFGFSTNHINIYVRGSGGAVQNSRTDSSAGFSSLVVYGTRDAGALCSNVTVSGNLVTGYASNHTGSEGWSDGISSACEAGTISDNHVVDPTDVGIVLYTAYPYGQSSYATGNIIVSAGLSAYGALAADPLAYGGSFAGSLMSGNQFWASPSTHFDIGILVGTMAVFDPDANPPNPRGQNGSGASVQNNTTANITTTVNTGILIDGMLNATVTQNNLLVSVLALSPCPQGNVVADWPAHASGTLQPWSQAAGHGCLYHADQNFMHYCHIPDYVVRQTASLYSDTGTCQANLAYYLPGQTTGVCYLSRGTAETECFPPQNMYYCHIPDYGVRQTSSQYTNTSGCQANLGYYLPGQTTGICYKSAAAAQAACAP